jgi:hypothetical protein
MYEFRSICVLMHFTATMSGHLRRICVHICCYVCVSVCIHICNVCVRVCVLACMYAWQVELSLASWCARVRAWV